MNSCLNLPNKCDFKQEKSVDFVVLLLHQHKHFNSRDLYGHRKSRNNLLFTSFDFLRIDGFRTIRQNSNIPNMFLLNRTCVSI